MNSMENVDTDVKGLRVIHTPLHTLFTLPFLFDSIICDKSFSIFLFCSPDQCVLVSPKEEDEAF